ncbi:unnamed protein product [Arctia plantaginis]|uniref:Uncharacterized protein n=1 Tax=Arctia plantaginis TaxID=874455 RepID=A0A8S0ZKQ9_ARCPL|nr:unnamed protein product [Arctia plantaginis]
MRPEEIEGILKQLENGEISEDDSTDNEDDIDYYSSQRDRLMELEDEEDVDIKVTRKIKGEDPVPTVDKTLQYLRKDPGQVYKYYPLLTCVAIVLVMKKYL